jgi:hypothetical protein
MYVELFVADGRLFEKTSPPSGFPACKEGSLSLFTQMQWEKSYQIGTVWIELALQEEEVSLANRRVIELTPESVGFMSMPVWFRRPVTWIYAGVLMN